MSGPSTTPRVWLVVPCFNEAARLRPSRFLDFVRASADAALLFVDDGSTDGTPGLLTGLAAAGGGRIGVLTLPRNAGKAAAVRLGVRDVLTRRPEYAGYWDADLSTPLDALPEFLSVLDSRPGIEVVIGSRVKLLGRSIARHAWRHYIGRVFATAAASAVGLPVYDTQCGAKVFRASGAVARAFESPFRSSWVFDVEVLARYVRDVGPAAAESGIFELPLREWADVPGSKVRVWDGVRAAWDLWRIRSMRRAGGRQ
jgi:dolichyl-phosphate beta-glucosyltransferase